VERNGLNEVVGSGTADGQTEVGLEGSKCVVCECYYFVFDSFRCFEPVEFFFSIAEVMWWCFGVLVTARARAF